MVDSPAPGVKGDKRPLTSGPTGRNPLAQFTGLRGGAPPEILRPERTRYRAHQQLAIPQPLGPSVRSSRSVCFVRFPGVSFLLNRLLPLSGCPRRVWLANKWEIRTIWRTGRWSIWQNTTRIFPASISGLAVATIPAHHLAAAGPPASHSGSRKGASC